MPLLEVYCSIGEWLAKRIHGPMPETDHLPVKQRLRLENALLDRTPPWFWATLGIGVAVLFPLLFFFVFYFHVGLVLPLIVLAILVATPIIQIILYGRDRRAHIEELRRLALRNCPECGYDLRTSPGGCPECGAGIDGAGAS